MLVVETSLKSTNCLTDNSCNLKKKNLLHISIKTNSIELIKFELKCSEKKKDFKEPYTSQNTLIPSSTLCSIWSYLKCRQRGGVVRAPGL